MSRGEFIALIAMMFAAIAFSIDAMLPALPEIGAELSPDAPNRAGLMITSFLLGMGVSTFFTGPLSDALGRKPVIYAGLGIYAVGALTALTGDTLELVLLGRLIQGVGVAAPRVVAMAIIRDLYAGRDMARMVSLAMMIFTIVPALAPMLGSGIIVLAGWRAIFVAFMLFALVCACWMALRLPESLAPEHRRAFRLPLMMDALGQMLRHPTVRLSIAVQALSMGVLFSTLVVVQPIYDITFGHGDSFPYWFGGVAAVSASASVINARLVGRVGMRRLVTWALGAQIGFSGIMLAISLTTTPGPVLFGLFVIWQTTLFFMAGMTLGNLNAIAMEPMGHIAGMAASVIGAIATVCASALASPVALLFDGSILPLAVMVLLLCSAACALMLHMGRVERDLARAI
ncbi:MAG: multidrug effflux MFS transporter [Marinibacterium sp.]|nr:multidrug effflux MFS transporter [Marinibacterium sp.]